MRKKAKIETKYTHSQAKSQSDGSGMAKQIKIPENIKISGGITLSEPDQPHRCRECAGLQQAAAITTIAG